MKAEEESWCMLKMSRDIREYSENETLQGEFVESFKQF
jgi:hypothetical protein